MDILQNEKKEVTERYRYSIKGIFETNYLEDDNVQCIEIIFRDGVFQNAEINIVWGRDATQREIWKVKGAIAEKITEIENRGKV